MNKFIADSISLIIPSKNDSKNIVYNLENVENFLDKNFLEFEILIISNGSLLQDRDVVDNLIKGKRNIKHITIEESGKGVAVKTGIEKASFNNVLFSDADFSVEIDEIENFFTNGKLNSDLVIGSRRSKDSKNLNSPIKRLLAGTMFIYIVNFVLGIKVKDSQCGFKAFHKKIYLENPFYEKGFIFDVEMIFIAKYLGLKISEVPVTYVHQNESSVNLFRDTFKMALGLIRIFFRYRLG
tara:strand:+ start:7343 stop:8059 length:717 start_codon:yes stop_codon:yes gene_type:complete